MVIAMPFDVTTQLQEKSPVTARPSSRTSSTSSKSLPYGYSEDFAAATTTTATTITTTTNTTKVSERRSAEMHSYATTIQTIVSDPQPGGRGL